MERKVFLSKRTKRKLESLLKYLENNWSTKTKNDFVKRMDKALNQIKIHPSSFPQSQIQNEIHKCVVTKQTTIYYRFDDKAINVITMFDNRQDPGKLGKEL